jgi:hypothetical protein
VITGISLGPSSLVALDSIVPGVDKLNRFVYIFNLNDWQDGSEYFSSVGVVS